MTYTIVYKTYENDLMWFEYSLKSLLRFVLPFNNIIKLLIYCNNLSHNKVKNILALINIKNITIQIVPVNYDYHGYIKQMIVKATAYLNIDTQYTVYVDSDCIFTDKYEFSNLINSNGNPYWYITNDVDNNGITVWKDVVKDMTFNDMKYYYMYNAFPFIIKTSTLKLANDKFIQLHNKTYDEFVKERLNKYRIKNEDDIVCNFYKLSKIFTEFEFIGFIAHNFTNDYEFILNNRNKKNLKQFWSHGGISNEIKNELNSILC